MNVALPEMASVFSRRGPVRPLVVLLIGCVLLVGVYLTWSSGNRSSTEQRQQRNRLRPKNTPPRDQLVELSRDTQTELLRQVHAEADGREETRRRRTDRLRKKDVDDSRTDEAGGPEVVGRGSSRDSVGPNRQSPGRRRGDNREYARRNDDGLEVGSKNRREHVRSPSRDDATHAVVRPSLPSSSAASPTPSDDVYGPGHKPSRRPRRLGDLRGGPGNCRVYDTRKDLPEEFDFGDAECVRLATQPGVVACPHPDAKDRHVSEPIRKHRIWEPHVVREFQRALEQDPTAGVYDIGANIGQYALIAAAMGRRVVAVEPYSGNVYRLHKAIRIGRLEDKIHVIQNAVSDVRDTFELEVIDGNPAAVRLTAQDADRFCDEPECPPHATTILMDDLLEVTNFETAVMKIDAEGFEHRAFAHADQLMTDVRLTHIFMEWTRMREFYGAEVDDSVNKRLVQKLVDGLVKRGYVAVGIADGTELNTRLWYGWPNDIVWTLRRKRTVT